MDALLLALLDSRAPTGGHSHSGGMEAAIMAGRVAGLADVERYCRTRLVTAGRVAADFAAGSARLAAGVGSGGRRPTGAPTLGGHPAAWARLDAELDARTPSAATRAASRGLGGGLRRLVRAMLPETDLDRPWAQCPVPAPHHPLVLGAAVVLAGGDPELAAAAARLQTVAAPAGAAVRLLGLDPFAVQGLIAGLVGVPPDRPVDTVGPPAAWASDAAPALDLLPDVHLTAEVRLFAS